MPNLAPHPCRKPGCAELATASAYCRNHEQAIGQARERARGTAASRGYGHKWRRAREAYLLANPLCVEHLAKGSSVAATVVDHVVAHKGDRTLFWSQRNWQALCKTCHDTKTAKSDGRWTPGGA